MFTFDEHIALYSIPYFHSHVYSTTFVFLLSSGLVAFCDLTLVLTLVLK